MTELHVCAFCRNTGRNGAQWLLYIGDRPQYVHRPCGEKLIAQAPEEAKKWARLLPSKELRDSFRAKSFWKQNFHGAKPAAREEPR